ncbi:MAG TPA: translation initiation factor IF-3 [Streptosporangiaceae bacterium]|nr:translation initiation factor IF-3 [Streptosporangiaceae bacterium]
MGLGQEESDYGGHISTEPRINERIRVPEVRLVGPSGEQVGIVSINDALRLAQEADLDLVEVAPTARPPVCKLMDYGKFKYESALKARESRKNQAQTVIKEIKIRPKIDPHDYGTKKGHVERFLKQGDKVKVTIMFRGREQSRPELGYKLLQRLAGDVEELGFVESQPKQDGRNMIMVIGPHRKKAETKPVKPPERASARASAPTAMAGRDEELPDFGSLAEQAPQASARPAAQPSDGIAAGPASRPAQASPRPAAPSAGQPPAGPRPAAPRPGPSAARPAPSVSSGAPASGSPRPAAPASSGSARPASPAQVRPAAPAGLGAAAPGGSTGSSQAATPRPGPTAGGPRPTAPRPGPSASGPRPAAPRPTAPKPGPVPTGAPRPAAPKPSAPRASVATSGEGAPVPTPRSLAAENGGSAAEAGG